MRFIITSAGNHSAVGELFFLQPDEIGKTKAEAYITRRCYAGLKERYGNNQSVRFRLEQELVTIHREDQFFSFWVLEQVAKVSDELGFPIIPHGTLGGALAAYLLGISPADPAKYDLPLAVVWESPSFEIAIAPSVRGKLHDRLDRVFGSVDTDGRLLQKITMVDDERCEKLGHLAQKHKIIPSLDDFDERVCTKVARSLALFNADEKSWLGEAAERIAEELAALPKCDFGMHVRIWGYLHGSIHGRRSLADLNDPHYIVLQDELFRELIDCHMAETDAADFVHRGIWRSKEKKSAFLKPYPVPEHVWAAINRVDYLWAKHGCINRLYEQCALVWYELRWEKE